MKFSTFFFEIVDKITLFELLIIKTKFINYEKIDFISSDYVIRI